MCTGDNLDTAKAIALNAGIISKHDCDIDPANQYTCMTGAQFREAVGGLTRVPNPTATNIDLEEDGNENGGQNNSIEVL